MLRAFAYMPDRGLVRDVPRERFREILDRPDAVLWVDLESATPGELHVLRNPFHVSALAVDECRDYTALPKVEDFVTYLLVILHRIQFDERTREMQLREIDFLLGPNWLVTVRADSSTSVEEVLKRIEATPEIMKEGPGRLLADVIDVVTSRYFPMVEFLEREIDEVEEHMLLGRSGDPFARIVALRHSVVALRRSLVPQREVIHRLAREEFKLVSGTSAHRLRNTHDELYWILTELEIHRELLTSSFEGHAALAANRLGDISNRMNRIMERLTRFTTVFMPLTLLTGVYGMNFKHMPELDWPWAYPAVLVLIVVAGIGLAVYFKKTLPPIDLSPEEEVPKAIVTKVWKRPGGAER